MTLQIEIKIIYEDNHILAAIKPANIPSQKDKSEDLDMLTLLKQDLKARHNKPGNVYLGLLHRLDRPAGGVMVFAKTSKAASRLAKEMRSGNFKKTYIAVAQGWFAEPTGILKHFLMKDRKTNIVTSAESEIKGTKASLLEYDVLEYSEGLSLVKINLITGRPHQIRVQFSAIGHPVWGDQKYGQNSAKPGEQLALWSSEIEFNHPVSKERMKFSSRPPVGKPWNLFRYFKSVKE